MTLRRVALGFLVLFVLAQVVPVSRTNPPATSEIAAPAEIDGILQRACYDCHSHETRWPWYARVAPVSWLLARDVAEGRKHVNWSTWGEATPRKQRHALEELVEVIEEGEMPPWFYLPLHPDARLSGDERQALIDWARATRSAIPRGAGK